MAKKNNNLEALVLDFLKSRPGHIFKVRALARELDISARQYASFKILLKSLTEQNRIRRHKGNKFGYLREPAVVTGQLHVKTQGYGFLIRDDGGEDLFISQRNMGSALDRDKVKVLPWAKAQGKLTEGRVIEILERGRTTVVGTFLEAKTFNYVMPDDLKINRDIYIDFKDSHNASIGQKVVVQIDDWGDDRRMPSGKVVEVLGYAQDKGVDVLSVAHTFNISPHFPKAVEKEARAIQPQIAQEEVDRRADFRNEFIFTIDPEDAKDFDDAVSLKMLENGHFQLGVHIADVSHYVQPNAAIDKEAYSRGTSVYLVDRVIPMLPESLSNEVCSLKPQTDRLTFSVIIEISPEGEIFDTHITESVIHSNYRLTYQQAHQIIHQLPLEKSKQRDSSIFEDQTLFNTLKQMHSLSQVLLDQWRHEGSIDFDVSEPKVELDETGKPIALGIRERLESHRLIEAFMLLANRAVAEKIKIAEVEKNRKLPFVYRIHEKPSGKKLDTFLLLMKTLGYSVSPKKITPKKIQTILHQAKDTPHQVLIEDVALRAMMKAQYSTKNMGHFGLAFPCYTHFTSPIRRYPDLMVHRLLKHYLATDFQPPQNKSELTKTCFVATDREIQAQEAEWESIKAKQIEFMAGKIGESYSGIISGVTTFGVFVEIPEYKVEGLIHINALEDDYYELDERHFRLIGRRFGKCYQIGMSVHVTVSRVLRDGRKLDFILTPSE